MRPFSLVRRLLDFAGRNGPLILLFGVLTGLVLPPLAELARPLMGLAVFCFTLGAFLKVDGPAFRAETARPVLLGLVLLWATFGVPLLVVLLGRLFGTADDMAQGLVLATLAPPVGSAAAVAVMLGLSAPIALIASVVATALAPISLPLLAAWAGGPQLSIDPWHMMWTLLLIVGGAALSAALLRRFAGGFVRGNPQVMTGIAVAGLLLVAVAAMRGMQPRLLADPGGVAEVLAIAFGINVALQGLGTLLFVWAGAAEALTAGLVSGNRNVTLAWAAAGMGLPAETELALAMCVFPIFMLPALFRWLIPRPAALLRRRPVAPAIAVSGD
jgi:BASS family bile acid:Na+ symporter